MVGRHPPHTEPAPQWRATESTSQAPPSMAWRMMPSETARQWHTTTSAPPRGDPHHRGKSGVGQGQGGGQGDRL